MTVERGRALFVSDHGVVPVSRGRGCLVHEGAGQLELAPGSRARIAWPGRCSVDLVGPASLGWRPDTPSEALRLDLVAVRAAELEVRQGRVRADLPGAWRLDLGEGAYGLEELPSGGVQLEHQAGRVARATWVGGAGYAPPPAEVWPGERVRLTGAPSGATRADRGRAVPGWSTSGWPWGEAAPGDPDAPIAEEPGSTPPGASADRSAVPPTGPALALSPGAPAARIEVLGGAAVERPREPWRRWDWPWRPEPDLAGQEAPTAHEPLPDERRPRPGGAPPASPQVTSPQPPSAGGPRDERPAPRTAADLPEAVPGSPGDSRAAWAWPWAPAAPAAQPGASDPSGDGGPAGPPPDPGEEPGGTPGPGEHGPEVSRLEGPAEVADVARPAAGPAEGDPAAADDPAGGSVAVRTEERSGARGRSGEPGATSDPAAGGAVADGVVATEEAERAAADPGGRPGSNPARPEASRADGSPAEGPEVDPPREQEPGGDGHRPELWRGLPASALGRRPTCVVQLGVPFVEVERPDGGLELHLPADAHEPLWYFAPTLDLRLFPGASLVLEPDGSIRYHTGQVRFLQGHPERRF